MESPTYRDRLRDELTRRCVHLKTKAAFLGMPGPTDVENDIDTAIWWCDHTCEPLGPDGHTADREGCSGKDRVCYRSPPRV